MIGTLPVKSLHRASSVVLFASLCLILACSEPGPVHGQTPLRWKLKQGDAFAVQLQQQTTSQVSFAGKAADTKIDLGLELLWTVAAADDKQFKVKQMVQRITFSLQPQKGDAVKYDSLNRARPTGQARQVADAVQPLLGAEIEFTMSDRGQVISTSPINPAAEKLFAEVSADQSTNVFSRLALQTLLRQPLVILPEMPVAADKTWTDEPREIKSAAGTFMQTTEYRHAGQVEEAGQSLEKIELTAKLTPVAASATKESKLTVKSHEHSGTILFSTAQGRLIRAEQIQKLATERPYRETTIAVMLDSKQTTTIRPAGEREESSGERKTSAP